MFFLEYLTFIYMLPIYVHTDHPAYCFRPHNALYIRPPGLQAYHRHTLRNLQRPFFFFLEGERPKFNDVVHYFRWLIALGHALLSTIIFRVFFCLQCAWRNKTEARQQQQQQREDTKERPTKFWATMGWGGGRNGGGRNGGGGRGILPTGGRERN